MRLCNRLYAIGFSLYCLAVPQPMVAQIVPDSSTQTDIESCHAQCRVIGGTNRGGNLFHSFQEFNVRRGQQVQFASPSGVENIFSRVTGENPSHIRGVLGVEGKANLFLLNPRGIVFGRNAQLNIQGSFIATTADRLIFSDGSEFIAANRQILPLLTVSAPVGLQFGQASRNIKNQGNLQVGPGRTLALIGSGINLQGDPTTFEGGSLSAVGGRIEVGSVAEGRVRLRPNREGFVFRYESIQSFQDINLSAALIDTSSEVGGAIHIQGRTIAMTDGSLVGSNTSGRGTGETLSISATESFRIGEDSLVGTTTSGKGNAGNVTIRALHSVRVNDSDLPSIYSQVCPQGCGSTTIIGHGGNLTIRTEQLIIQNAHVGTTTFGAGNAGNIEIETSDIEISGTLSNSESGSGIFTQSEKESIGNAGNITIATERFIAQEGGRVVTSTFASGNAGRLTINATDSVRLSGAVGDFADLANLVESGLFAAAEPGATGNAGRVDITTPDLTVENGAAISVRNFGRQGGSMIIRADSILLDGGERHQARLTAFTAADSEIGKGIGTIDIRDPNLLIMRNGSRISTASITDVNADAGAGNIHINAPNGFIIAAPQQDNDIFASAFAGRGGNIDITARGILGFEEYSEQAFVEGNGTNDINVGSLGIPGTVEISAVDFDPTQGATELPTIPITTELVQGCQVEGSNATAEFFETGRGGLPPTPYEPLSGSEILDDVRLPVQETDAPTPLDQEIAEAKAWVVNEQGKVVLVAEAPAQFQGCQLR
jgi:filamentous hemagglutinin family protein